MAGSEEYAHTDLRMDEERRSMSGSAARDLFRLLHKNKLAPHMFGADLDFVWVEKNPYKVIAGLDLKLTGDGATFVEVIMYNEWIKHVAPLFLVFAESKEAITQGAFIVYRYDGGDPGPAPPTVNMAEVCRTANWEEFGEWQQRVRKYVKKTGWPPPATA